MPETLAVVTPLPPLASGIADYSAELLPHLARHFALEVFAEPGSALDPLPGGIPVHPLAALAARHSGRPFDAVVYELGNNGDFHAGAYRTLFEVPGIVVLHELVLHHMVRELTLVAGDRDAYLDAIRYCCGASGWLLARRSLDTGTPFDVWSYPLFERVVDASLGVLVHSEESRRRILASRPLARVEVVPQPWSPGAAAMGADRLQGEEKAGWVRREGGGAASVVRRRLGLPLDAFLVCAFGYMTRAKRLDVALRAFARFAERHAEAVFVVVGEVSKDYDMASLVPEALRPCVVLTGRPPLDAFVAYMEAADLAVNLRWPTAGESSAALYRLLGLGKPVIVTDTGSFAELPDGCVAKVPPDETEEEVLLSYLELLATDPAVRSALGANARRHVEAHHRVDRAAARHAEAIRALLAAPARPESPVPPLAPYPPEDVFSDVIAGMTAAAVDLGATEADGELLRGLAEDVATLGLLQEERRGTARTPIWEVAAEVGRAVP